MQKYYGAVKATVGSNNVVIRPMASGLNVLRYWRECKQDQRKYLSFAKSEDDLGCRLSWVKLALMVRANASHWYGVFKELSHVN